MLLGRNARQWLEPVRKVGRALLERPLLHGVRHLVGDAQIQRAALVNDLRELLVGWLGEALLHHQIRKNETSKFFRNPIFEHGDLPSRLRPTLVRVSHSAQRPNTRSRVPTWPSTRRF